MAQELATSHQSGLQEQATEDVGPKTAKERCHVLGGIPMESIEDVPG